MSEDFLHYIWQNHLYLSGNSRTVDGEPVVLVKTGVKNNHAGPDFTDVRVKIGDTLWAGCVEIHLLSSDWERHGHHRDAAYNNVVLHVVYRYDTDSFNVRGQKIPVMELHFDAGYYDTYSYLMSRDSVIACRDELMTVDAFTLSAWIQRLTVERLEQKATAIMQTYASTMKNWEETLYIHLAKNFGFGLNALPFEMLARSLPFSVLSKHRDHLRQIESLLFGQAGILGEENSGDTYFTDLRKEYAFLKQKYRLVPVDRVLWKFLRLRPVNFPTVRIAQFAAFIHRNEHLFSRMIEAGNIEDYERIFKVEPSEYWDVHYVFGKETAKRRKSFGIISTRTVLINTVIPFLFIYGKVRGKEDCCNRAVELLEKLPPEKNAVLSEWERLGVRNTDAFVSQALLQLKNEYCSPKRCLHCVVGNKIVKNGKKI